jgi:hypothetical protein
LHGLSLGDSSTLIPITEISTTTFEKPPVGITEFTHKDNKVYSHTENGLVEYPLHKRIKSVLEDGGILHLKSGAKYVIENNVIIGIGIHLDLLEPFKKLTKSDIERKFGNADKVKETVEGIDETLLYTEFYYKDRLIKILFDDWDNTIGLINIGRFKE